MLIVHGLIAAFDAEGRLWPDGALRIVNDRIADVGESVELLARYPNDDLLDAKGKLVMPGLICAHTHFYGAFARGIPARGQPTKSFGDILERLWWRLDRALRPEDIRSSVDVCAIDAIRHGTTTLFDHHSSPNCVEGVLDIIAEAIGEAGLRASLCYEVTDRDGKSIASAGIRENVRFMKRCRAQPHPQLAGMMGLHASLTLSNETLEMAIGFAEDLEAGCHIHVAEGKEDVADCLRQYGLRVVERLVKARVLTRKTLAAHCVHVDDYELDALRETGARVVHNPRSNMNNAVGTARVPRMLRRGIVVGLGNDGFSNDMFTEMQTASLVHKLASGDPTVMPADDVLRVAIYHNRAIASEHFGVPLGLLAAGAAADVIIVDYDPFTPLLGQNLAQHVVFGLQGAVVDTTICAGKVLMRDRQLTFLDEETRVARARERARKLWARY